MRGVLINIVGAVVFLGMIGLALFVAAELADGQGDRAAETSICKRSAITPQEYVECDR
jgi:hypothetical protein